MKKYIRIGNVNKRIFNKIKIKLVTDEVVFTYERIEHVNEKRRKIYNEIKDILPDAIYNPDYIFKDWNNRENTLIFIKAIDNDSKINIIIKIALENDKKHSKNSIMTIIKIGQKTFDKILKNKKESLLFEKYRQK